LIGKEEPEPPQLCGKPGQGVPGIVGTVVSRSVAGQVVDQVHAVPTATGRNLNVRREQTLIEVSGVRPNPLPHWL
jgi:hypothetical protein